MGRLTGLAPDFAGTAQDVTYGYGYNPAAQIVSRTISNDLYTYAQPSETVAYTPNGLNQNTTVAGAAATFAYDLDGNLTSEVTATGTTTYVYDAENRLVSSSTGAALAYDPLGRLFQVSSPTAGTRRLLYDGDALVAKSSFAARGSQSMMKLRITGLLLAVALLACSVSLLVVAKPELRLGLVAGMIVSVIAFCIVIIRLRRESS